jgi:hypothetical protein
MPGHDKGEGAERGKDQDRRQSDRRGETDRRQADRGGDRRKSERREKDGRE